MADPLGTVGNKVAENLVDRILNFILNPITVVRKCNENVESLKNRVEKLKGEKMRVENYTKNVHRRGEEVDATVPRWVTKAEGFIQAAEKPVRDGDEFAKKECFFRLCPNPIPRYKLSKEAEKNSLAIDDHLEVARGFGPLPLSYAPPPQQDVDALVEGFEEFSSRKIVLNQIMEALRSPTVNTIGVYGTSGMGKTMLVKMVKGKAAQQDKLFTAVVMATVTKNPDLKKIQYDIARDLDMDQLPTDLPPDEVLNRVKTKLIEKEKFLVILDDVWETGTDILKQVGIPSASELKKAMEKKNEGSSSGQEDMLCKILLTSRHRSVLYDMMDGKDHDQVFEVKELKEDEAWHLFKKIVGSKVETSDLEPTARQIVEKCLGFPLSIVSVGKAMTSMTRQHEWETALVELKKPTRDGISAAVYKPIELSYNYLQGNELKQTFMLCSLLGHDSSINDLLKYGMGLNLFPKVKTIEETRAKVLTLVHRLKQSSLLVDGHSNMHFGMHDQIREIALSIAAREHGVLALVDEDVEKEWPEEETMEKLKWIYLSNVYPELTSNGLICPRLTFFHLSNKGCSLAAPTDLFTGTKGLKVLCLTKIDFQSTHSQMPLIPTKLHTLLLDQCVFTVKELGSIVGNLENLQVLSLAGCAIEELPREIEKLSKLKLLDVSDCTKLKVVPPQVLPRLSELEELKMGNSFDRWDDGEEGNARLVELMELHKLTAIEVRISNFQETLFPENLKRFKIFIGIVERDALDRLHWYRWNSYSWESSFESSKIMKVKLQGASIKSNDSIKMLLKKTEELYLEGLNGVENLVYELNDEGFQHLKCLHVQNAPDITHIFNPAGSLVPSHVFPILEVLTLFNLEKMKKICDGLTGAATFKGLKKITVVDCHQLKSLFSSSMARQLQLQEIIVERCANIEQIIDDVEEQGNGNDIVEESEGCELGNSLRSLTLMNLAKLIGFNSNCSDISLFNDKIVIPNLQKLELFGIKINQLWTTYSCVENPQEILNFKGLKRLQIMNCSSSEYLFTPSMVSGLGQLKELHVSSCNDLKQVIMAEGVEEAVNTELIFPQLNSILLANCNRLSSFYAGSGSYALKFQSAIKIEIWRCPNMITFVSTFSTEKEKETAYQKTDQGHLQTNEPNICSQTLFDDMVVIPVLDDLSLRRICVQQIWHNQITPMSSFIKKLRKLTLEDCNNLKYLFTSSMVKIFEQLEVLEIDGCKEMQVVILIEEPIEKERTSQAMFPKPDSIERHDFAKSGNTDVKYGIKFSQLKSLELTNLPKLSTYSTGKCDLEFPSLKEVIVTGCPRMKYFSMGKTVTKGLQNVQRTYCDTKGHWAGDLNSTIQELFTQKVSYLESGNLWLSKFPELIEIWKKNPEELSSLFQNLRHLKVCNCNNLSYLLTPTMKLAFVQLEGLEIEDCAAMEQVIMVTGVEEVVETGLTFLRLKEITVKKCPKMVRFTSKFSSIQEKGTIDGKSEEMLVKEEPDIFIGPFFCDEIVFLNLEKLELNGIKINQLWTTSSCVENPQEILNFKGLKRLQISNCSSLEYLFTPSMVSGLGQLQELRVSYCNDLKQVIMAEGVEEAVNAELIFPELNSISLSNCYKLSSFYAGSGSYALKFQSAIKIEICRCPNMITETEKETAYQKTDQGHLQKNESNICSQTLFDDMIVFPNLQKLELFGIKINQLWTTSSCVENPQEILNFKGLTSLRIFECSISEYLFTPSMVSGLGQLKELRVLSCNDLKQVIMAEGVEEAVNTELIFPQLNSIVLAGCNRLSSFYAGSASCALKFQSDIEIRILRCPNMITFVSTFSTEKEKETAYQKTDQGHLQKDEPNIRSQTLFNCDKLSTFYAGSGSYALKFQSAIKIEISECPNMITFVSTFSTEKEKETAYQNTDQGHLQKNEPNICSRTLFDDMVVIPVLDDLSLCDICVRQIWHNQITPMSSFVQKLRKLSLWHCDNLKYLFTSSMVKIFEQLEKLQIKDCEEMQVVILIEEPIEKERTSQTTFSKPDSTERHDFAKSGNTNVKDGIMFSQLKSLELTNLPKLSTYSTGKCDLEFPSLKEVIVIECPQMKYFSMGKTVAKGLQNVQWKHHDKKGHWVGDLNSTIQDLFTQKVSYLKGGNTLWLSKFSELIEIWKMNPEKLWLLFQNLRHLKVCNCNNLSYLLTPNMALAFVQPVYVEIKDCAAMEQVIMVTGFEEVVETGLTFPWLKSILLESCSKLSSFCVGSNALRFPLLEIITVKNCPKMVRFTSKFSSIQEKETTDGKSEEMLVKEEPDIFIGPFFCDMVEFPKLKLLKLTSMNIHQIWPNEISKNSSSIQNLKALKELVVEGCGNLKYLLTFSMVESFEQLTELQICDCKMMEIVILTEKLGEEERMSEIFFPKLHYLKLKELPILTRFCSGNFLEFSSLVDLRISKCPMLKTFISSSIIGDTENGVNADAPYLFDEKVKFPKLELLKLTLINIHQVWPYEISENSSSIQNLKELEELVVEGCGNLKYLLTSSMVESFKELTKLQICDCKMMETVIFTEELGKEERMSKIFFPRLHYLKLKELPILTRFCSRNFLEFSSLTDIQMSKCPMLKTFISGSIIGDTENEVNTYAPYLFDEKIKIPIWKTLALSAINIRQIWNSQLSSISSFAQHLTKLKVVNCCNLKYLLTFSMVKSFAQLEELMISECEIMEEVILIEGMAEEERIYWSMFPQLKILVLNDLPQLATFCSNCDSLGEISEPERVNFGIGSQELVATESTSMETKATKVVFSQVTWLALRLLPKFKYFFPQTHITEWPLLERLVVMECHQVQIVASKFSSIEMAHGDNQLERESQPLMFWISKVTFPSLKHLAVKWNDNLKIWCGHHPEEYFGLEVLTLIGFPKQSAFPPPFFFESLPNLKELVVKDAFLSEIFQCEEVTAKEKPVYGHTSLSKLRLSKLYELTHLWKEESQLEADILNNLRYLKVQECSRLKNLVPSTIHFDNLQTLVVSECHGLVNLIRYSTAKSLGQLGRMEVANCEMIEEIVVCLGDAVKDDGIVFTNLQYLQLKGLPRLESFCSWNCNFKFPALRKAIVTECPKMQIFSKGELSTRYLREVKLTRDIYEDMGEDIEKKLDDLCHEDEGVEDDEVEDKSCWHGDLNSTIHHLFKEKSAHNSKKSNEHNSDHEAKEDGN